MQNNEFSVTEEKTDDGTLKLTVNGKINTTTSISFEKKISRAFEDGNKRIVVNMSNVPFLSSVGIRVLLKFFKRAKIEDGSFLIEDPSENVQNVLGMTALYEMLLK